MSRFEVQSFAEIFDREPSDPDRCRGYADGDTIVDPRGNLRISVEEAQARFDVGRIIRRFGTWAVCDDGVSCLHTFYFVDKKRVHEGDWVRHMNEKVWVNISDFSAALHYAQRLWRKGGGKKGLSKRFRVLQRDGYRCQLCGRTAAHDGVRLEVDHKHPRAKGGSDHMGNLWTLCFDCNRGKSDRLI